MTGASSELFPPQDKKAESAVVKKLKQPKKKKEKDGKEDGSVEDEEEEEEEEEKGGMGSLMIVKTAGEAWERLQERLKESPIIQVRWFRGRPLCPDSSALLLWACFSADPMLPPTAITSYSLVFLAP